MTPHAGKAAGSGAGKSAPPPPPAKPSKQLFVSASDGQLPPLPEALAKTCGAVYAALGVASAAAGGALTVAAVRGPHQLLPPALHGDALAATMVTLVPALLLHSSGALLFLAGGCAAGELATARYQRVNVALAACAACVLLVQATGVQHASGLLVGSLSALSVSTLAVCAWVLRSMLAAGPIALLGAWRLGDGTAAHNLAAGAVYFARDVSSLPGFMCVAGLALSAIAGALLLVAPGAGLGAAPPPVDAPASLLPLLLYTRRLVGCSLLLAASSFHALLEAAAERRSLAPAAEATIGVLRYEFGRGDQLESSRYLP